MDNIRERDEFDIYAVPDDSPPPAKRAKNTSRQPRNPHKNTTGDTIHVSTLKRRMKTIHRKEPSLPSPHPQSREKPTFITRIHRALKTKPGEGWTIGDIFDWLRINDSKVHDELGPARLRERIEKTLDREPGKEKSKVWRDTDGKWRLKSAVAEPNAEESTKTYAERQMYTPSLLIDSSPGGQSSDGTPGSHEDMPQSDLQHSREGDYENGQDVQPAASLPIESEYESTSINSRPQAQAQEMDAYAENETPQPQAATRSAQTVDEQTSNPNNTPTQQSEPPAESTSMIHNDKPSSIEEGRVPVDLCHGPEQAKSINTPTPTKRLKPVQYALKPLVEERIPSQAPGITTEEICQHVMANPTQAMEWSNTDTLKAHVRAILRHMHVSGEALRESAKGENGGQTFAYTRSPSFQMKPFPPAHTPSMRFPPTAATPANKTIVQYVSGPPANLSHVLWRQEEELPLVNPVTGACEPLDDNDGAQNTSQPGAPNQFFAELEPTIRASDRSGSELPQAQDGSVIGGEDPDKADKELLETARRLRAEMELATNDLSMSEFQMQQAQSKCFKLERQASEQRSKEVELRTHAQCLREELMKIESEAAECQEGADRLEKEADNERNSRKKHESIIAATKERATEIEKKRQKIRDELKV